MKLDHESEEAVSILAAGCGLTAAIFLAAALVALLPY